MSPNIPLPWTGNPATSGLQSYQNETAIAADPTNAGRAVAAAISGYRDPATACSAPMAGLTQTTVALYVSLNSQTWNYACAPWPSASVSLCGTNCSYTAGDPSVAWDGNGVPFACFLVTAACEGCLPYAAAIVLARYDTQTNLWSPVGYVVNRLANDIPSGGNCENIQCSRPSWQTSVDVYHFYSANGGTAWTQTTGRLNDDDPTTKGVHFFPWLAVDQSDGSVNVAWYDSRIDTVNNNKTQVIYARSVNGGATFEPNVLLTDGGSNFLNHVNYSNEDWQCAFPFGDGNPGAFRDQYGD